MTTETIKYDARHKSPDELEREADRARADVEHTIERLEQRLSPGELVDRAMRAMTDGGGDFGRTLVNQVRHHPLPTILTGIGLTWLMAASERTGSDTYGAGSSYSGRSAMDAASRAAGRTADGLQSAKSGLRSGMSAAAGAAQSAKETVSGAADSARQTTHEIAGTTREITRSLADAGRSAGRSYTYLRQEQPLVLGAIGVATGALLGALLPSSDVEDEYLGSLRDDATRRLKAEGQRRVEHAKRAAGDAAADAAREALTAASKPASKRTDSKAGDGRAPDGSSTLPR